MEITTSVTTKKKSPGKNTKQYIIVHHTGGGTFKSNMETLSVGVKAVSVHYVVGLKGEIGKIGEHGDILWHAGISEWKGKSDMNKYSIGIEIVSDGFIYSDIQRERAKELIQYIMDKEKIPKENVLRHIDIAPNRKRDVGPNFWDNKYSSWVEYQNSLTSNVIKMNIKQVIQAVISLNSFLWDNIENEELRDLLTKTNTILRTMV